jgi:predicted ATPase
MIIELQNFGPIKSFKFDTSKDMHAIFGKNNIGKSYAISAVYLILKGLKEQLEENPNESDYAGSLKLISSTDEIYKYDSQEEGSLNYIERTFIASLNKSFENTFDIKNLKNINSSNQKPAIKIDIEDLEIDLLFSSNLFKLILTKISFGSYTTIDKTVIPNQVKTYNKKDILINQKDIFWGIPQLEVFHSNLQYLKKVIEKELAAIFYLPASRSGLYNALNSFGAIFAELSKNRNFIRNKIEIPNISEPISDYFLNLNTIDKAQANEHYLKHFEEIEQEILKGKITLDNESKKYYYVPTGTDMRLELSFTSSMISEIAPIIAHLKYIIPLESDKPSILFIEEPEAHLHPEIQILLIEYFVKLSKGNVKIVMTSHSNYIFNKLSNLLIANKIDKEKLSVSLMKMTPEGSVIEDGAMQMDEYGIEDNNFVDVAEQLYEERMSLLEKL